MKSFFIHFLIFFLFSCHLYGEKIDVIYAGFALSAEFSDLNTTVKYTNKIIEKAKNKGAQNIIDKSLIEVTKKLDLNHINLSYDLITEETSKIALSKLGKIEEILISEMTNKKSVKDNLIDLISKIGEKITLRRSSFIGTNNTVNFSYTHSSLKKMLEN